jgi:very-short-patch-repair endonuclease
MDGVAADGTLLPVLLCVGTQTHRHRQSGIDVSRDRLPSSDVVVVGDLRCTTPLRTAFDLARRALSETAAVIAIDTMVECGLIDRMTFQAYADEHGGWRGVPRARAAAALSVEGVRSPRETKLRMICNRAGLPTLLVNHPVFSVEGYLIGIPDLLCPESATVIEYDGADHLEPQRRAEDSRRDARFRVHGLNTVRVTRDDINGPHDTLVERLRRAYLDGLSRDSSSDRWTLEIPADWVPPDEQGGAS